MKEQVKTLVTLCHRYGTTKYVKGGGGNISWKKEDILLIKASGTYLSQASEDTLVAVSRQPLRALYQASAPQDLKAREAWAKQIIQQAVVFQMAPGRASVETPLHDLFEATYVVHTHPPIVNGLSCARDAESACHALFPEAMWVPYVDPGVTLCLLVKRQFEEYITEHGREPSVIIMQNHGLVIAADTLEEIDALHEQVFETLGDAYRNTGLDTRSPVFDCELAEPPPPVDLINHTEQDLTVLKCSGFDPAPAPLTPDHVVYSGVEPFDPDNDQSLAAYRAQFGTDPRLVLYEGALYAFGLTSSQARAACDLAADGAHVIRLTGAFGGARFMSEEQWRFVVNWEAETYRQSVIMGN